MENILTYKIKKIKLFAERVCKYVDRIRQFCGKRFQKCRPYGACLEGTSISTEILKKHPSKNPLRGFVLTKTLHTLAERLNTNCLESKNLFKQLCHRTHKSFNDILPCQCVFTIKQCKICFRTIDHNCFHNRFNNPDKACPRLQIG